MAFRAGGPSRHANVCDTCQCGPEQTHADVAIVLLPRYRADKRQGQATREGKDNQKDASRKIQRKAAFTALRPLSLGNTHETGVSGALHKQRHQKDHMEVHGWCLGAHGPSTNPTFIMKCSLFIYFRLYCYEVEM